MKLDIRTDADGNKRFIAKTQAQSVMMSDNRATGERYYENGTPIGYRYPLSELKRVVKEGPQRLQDETIRLDRDGMPAGVSTSFVIYERLYTMTGYDIDDYRDALGRMEG